MQKEELTLEIPTGLLELDMQELEPMDAPGFWTGIGIGAAVSSATVAAAAFT